MVKTFSIFVAFLENMNLSIQRTWLVVGFNGECVYDGLTIDPQLCESKQA